MFTLSRSLAQPPLLTYGTRLESTMETPRPCATPNHLPRQNADGNHDTARKEADSMLFVFVLFVSKLQSSLLKADML